MAEIYHAFMQGPSILEKAYKISRETLGKIRKLPGDIITLIQNFAWDYYLIEQFQDENKALYWPKEVTSVLFGFCSSVRTL